MFCVRNGRTLETGLRPEKESFKLARAARPSQKLALPAESYGALSQSQAEDIVKAAASRIATRKVRQECTSEILRAEQMRVEKVGVAREVPPSNSRAQLADTIGLQVDRLRTVREVTKTHGREPDSTLEDVSKLGNSSREVLNIADTAADRFAVNLASPIVVQWSQPSGINPEGKHVHQVAVMTYTPVTEGFESIGRNQVRITTAKLLKRERQLSEEKIEPQARKKANETQISTVAQGDRIDEMVEQLLREMEELDESHKLSDEDETVINALLKNWNLKTQAKMKANGLNSSTWKKSLYTALVCTKYLLNVFVMSSRQLGDQRRTLKQKGSSPTRVPKWIAVMSDTTARTQKKLSPNTQLLPAGSNSGCTKGSIVGAKQKTSKRDCNDCAGRPTESMADGNMRVSRWDCVGCAGRPTESMADGNPAKP